MRMQCVPGLPFPSPRRPGDEARPERDRVYVYGRGLDGNLPFPSPRRPGDEANVACVVLSRALDPDYEP